MWSSAIGTSMLLAWALLVQTGSGEDQGASVEYTDDDQFRDAVLNVTNTYRKQHNATSLEWNNTLADYAQNWGDDCKFEHSGGPSGENLASGYPNATASIVAWGHERVDYDFDKGEFTHETGHFTQLVWKSTTTVGCSRTSCNSKSAPGWYVVCEYYPPGNVIGYFKQNVQEEVPEDKQPEGPSDPAVPEDDNNGKEDCPMGAVCSAAGRVGRSGLLIGALAVGWISEWTALW